MKSKLSAIILSIFALASAAPAAPNSWFAGSDKWEIGSNWSLGIPPAVSQSILITNAGHNTVLIDAVTTNSPATLSISNLTLTANQLSIASTGTNAPLVVTGSLTVNPNSGLAVSNGAILIRAALSINGSMTVSNGAVVVGALLSINGNLSCNSSSVIATNSGLTLGSAGAAVLNLSGGSSLRLSGALSVNTNSSVVLSNAALLAAASLTVNGGMSCNDSSIVASNGSLSLASIGGANVTLTLNGGSSSFSSANLTTLASGKSTLLVQNGTTTILGGILIGQGGAGTLTVNGGTLQAFGSCLLGSSSTANGFVLVNGGTMIVTNSSHNAFIEVRHGSFVLSNGTVLADIFMSTNTGGAFINNGATLIVTTQARMDAGTQTVASGSAVMYSNLVVASTGASTGTVNVTGGSLVITNGVLGVGNGGDVIGDGGFGSLAISNATVLARSIVLGSTQGGHGIMTLKSGGVLQFPAILASNCTDCGLSLNEAVLDGGEIDASGSPFFAGKSRPGELIVSNGVATFLSGYVGIDNPGSMEMAAGSVTVLSNLVVGDCAGNVTGSVTVTGGNLYVTNATHDAVLDIRGGVFSLSGGGVHADILIMTNSCGLFVHSGGTLVYGMAILDPNGDSDGDGIPNGYEQSHGLDPFKAADATADNDGDGFSNLQEFQAGTDPNDAGSSPLRITSIQQQNSDILITWSTFAGTTNSLQATLGALNGSYATDGFYDIFMITNAAGSTTNYLDSGAVTNAPAKYYRVRLIP